MDLVHKDNDFHYFTRIQKSLNIFICFLQRTVNPLPYIPILGSCNSAANKDMKSKLRTNGDTFI